MSARNAEVADAITAQGYKLDGFGPAMVATIDGRRSLVSASPKQNLCAVVQHRAFRMLALDDARRAFPQVFA